MVETYRIYGPPGTGKTTYLLSKVKEELASGVYPEQVVYTSFTKSGAREARDRALAQFKDYSPDQFHSFSTIHSICFRRIGLKRENVFAGKKLSEFCHEFGYDVALQTSHNNGDFETELPNQVLQTEADYYEYFINWYRNLMMDFDDAYRAFVMSADLPRNFTYDRLKTYIERRNEYKRANSLFSFTDMLEVALENQIMPSDDFKVIVQDEAQDLSPLLAQVAAMWALKAERYYVGGDIYQALYSFMGADPSIMLNMKADHDIRLKQSYRCPIEVHDLSRRIVGRFSARYSDDDFAPVDKQGAIARCFPSQLKWDEILGGDDSVFYLHRTHYLLNQAFNELISSGIPFGTLHGYQSPLQSAKARVASSMLKLVNGKHIPISDVVKLMDYLPSKTQHETYLKLGTKTGTKKLAHDNSAMNVSARDLHGLGFTQDFMNHFTPNDVFSPLKLSIPEKTYFNLLVRRFGPGILDKEPKLILGTLHSVKGMECDTAIINTNLTRRTYDGMQREPDPEHRLFYTAVTRSKNSVIILQPEDLQSYYL